jgi:protein-S-isoprenylcysteine O-methyltransferase Ste14
VRINPPLIYQTFMVVMVAIYFLLPSSRVIPLPYNLLGLPLFVFGVHVALRAKRDFQAAGTPMSPVAIPTRLHREGYFRYSRNPMYLGISVGLLGFAMLWSALWNFVFPLLFAIVVDLFYIRSEERTLKETFGDEYEDYKRQVRRWI